MTKTQKKLTIKKERYQTITGILRGMRTSYLAWAKYWDEQKN